MTTAADPRPYWFREFDQAQRDQAAADHAAMPDGGFPIYNRADLHNAMQAIGRASDPAAARSHIRTRAKALGLEAELSDAFKATDPAHEEADASNAGKVLTAIDALITSERGEDEDESADISLLQQARALVAKFQKSEQAEAGSQAVEPDGADMMAPTIGDGTPAKPMKRVNRYAAKLKSILRGKVSDDDLEAAHRQAMAHAGGMARSAARKQAAEPFTFAELRFIEPPAWIPYLPKPGSYTHPEWGKVVITPARNKRFMDNFKAGVYQAELPIDAEHQTKLSGAMGFIHDMRQNADGSVDAATRWTERGEKLLRANGFSRFSPEWFDKWSQPETGKSFDDVAIGGALTNRPFFKDQNLRPLAATEHVIGAVWQPARQYSQEAPVMADNPTPTQATDAEQAKTFAEKLATLEAENAALRQANETNRQASEKANQAVEVMQAEVQSKRFTDEIMGRSDANGTRWWVPTREGEDHKGAVERTVGTLRTLASTFGEASPEFTAYVAQQRQMAETMRASDVFRAAGQPGGGEPAGAEARAEALVRQYTERDPNLSRAAAMDRVFSDDPALYQQYEAERTRRIASSR